MTIDEIKGQFEQEIQSILGQIDPREAPSLEVMAIHSLGKAVLEMLYKIEANTKPVTP